MRGGAAYFGQIENGEKFSAKSFEKEQIPNNQGSRFGELIVENDEAVDQSLMEEYANLNVNGSSESQSSGIDNNRVTTSSNLEVRLGKEKGKGKLKEIKTTASNKSIAADLCLHGEEKTAKNINMKVNGAVKILEAG